MLDTHGRKYFQPIIRISAEGLLKAGLEPNTITVFALFLGILSSVTVYFDLTAAAVFLLWTSGFLDAVDGTMARLNNSTSPWGTLLDITFDRVVELSVIFSLALKYPDIRLHLIILTGCIILSMTVFLTVGALAENTGIKSFYYQAGLAERTEGFIFFSLMIMFKAWNYIFIAIFSAAIAITVIQRLREAHRLLNS